MNDVTPIRLGMVGGGQGAFIGGVHRIAARIDGQFNLVAGALASTPEKAAASAKEIGLERSYGSYQEMATAEAAREDGIEAVAIVTPNHVHYPAAKAFLEAGIHVICDKPLTSTLEDALALEKVANKANALFILTHNYTGYPMIRQAKSMIANGELGDIRLVQTEYPQDWLTEAAEQDPNNKQADWRTDPERSGAGGCVGDIGTHAYNIARFVTGLKLDSLAGDLDAFVDGRRVDDNVNVLLRFEGGAKGMLWASQVAVGNENGLALRVYGTKGGLEWVQADPNYLWYTPFGEPKRLLTRGGAGANDAANTVTRIPGGHPEGYLEGFATIYMESANAIRAFRNGGDVAAALVNLPNMADGVEGVKFIDACIRSSNDNAAWVKLA